MKGTAQRWWFAITCGICLVVILWGHNQHIGEWWHFRGRWYFEKFRAERLIRQDPNSAENWSLLACSEYDTGDYIGSLEAYRHAWRLGTNNIDLAYAVAFGMREVGHDAEAEIWFSNIVNMCEQRGHPEWELNATNNLWIIEQKRKQGFVSDVR
jgi:hypothetical protein